MNKKVKHKFLKDKDSQIFSINIKDIYFNISIATDNKYIQITRLTNSVLGMSRTASKEEFMDALDEVLNEILDLEIELS